MATLLWILAAVLVISGIFALVRKQVLWGIVLIVVGLIVGGGAFEAVPVHAGAQPAAFLVHDPVLIHAPARALRLDHGRFGAQVDYVGFRRAHGGGSRLLDR